MKYQQFCEPQSGNLVHKLPSWVTFAYDLYLGHLRDHWKDMDEEYNNENGLYLPFGYGEP